MKTLILIIVLALVSTSAFGMKLYAEARKCTDLPSEPSSSTCHGYVNNYKNHSEDADFYIGYIHQLNMVYLWNEVALDLLIEPVFHDDKLIFFKPNLEDVIDYQGMELWVEKYCRENLEKDLRTAVWRLTRELRKIKTTNSSPITKTYFDD